MDFLVALSPMAARGATGSVPFGQPCLAAQHFRLFSSAGAPGPESEGTSAKVATGEGPCEEELRSDCEGRRGPLLVASLVLASLVLVVLAGVASVVASTEGLTGGVASAHAARRRLEAASRERGKCLTAAEGEVCHRLVLWAMEDGIRLQPALFEGLTATSSFEAFQAAMHEQAPEFCPAPCECYNAVDGDPCHTLMLKAMVQGIRAEPMHFPGLSTASKREEFQAALHRRSPTTCPRPCMPTPTSARGAGGLGRCDYGHLDPSPAPAGCFVSRNGTMLALKLAPDGQGHDLPGGLSDGLEPARCTAHREVLEETGYLVAPRDLLATVRDGFRIYRCELLFDEPVRTRDGEAPWVDWLTREEVQAKEWRFPEAAMYAKWIK